MCNVYVYIYMLFMCNVYVYIYILLRKIWVALIPQQNFDNPVLG